MKLTVSALALSTALLFSPMIKAFDQTTTESFREELNGFDINWPKGTAEEDLFEIELGILAQKNVRISQVKCWAKLLSKTTTHI